MKTASLITVHVGFNFGSVLQTIATVKQLEKLNIHTIVLNYIPDRAKTSSFLFSAKGLRLVKRVLFLPNYLINKHVYSRYLRKHVSLTEPFYSDDPTPDHGEDYHITGSDQVWNYSYNGGIDEHYFFKGVNGHKLALSSSMGTENPCEDELKAFDVFLPSYSGISVREASAKTILTSRGFNVEQLIDPTFFLSKEEWIPYMSDRLIKDKYLLVYTPYNVVDKEAIYKVARKIAKERNLLIVTFSWDYFTDSYADKTVRYASPGDFLSLMYYSEVVITNSFHGTAFSINLNKDFLVFMPSTFSTRISSILDLFKLNERLVSDFSESCLPVSPIDYKRVSDIISAEQKRAQDFLNNAMNLCI